jgi:RIO kinase 1
MELVTDSDGNAAPRLNDVLLSPEQARTYHLGLIGEVVRMLTAGVVHGDLSEFNILIGADGPVIIDLPQAIDAAGNNHAQRMLLRDVDNLRDFFGRFAPELLATQYGNEIWDLYQSGALVNDIKLTGKYRAPTRSVDVRSVMREIDDVRADEAARVQRQSS